MTNAGVIQHVQEDVNNLLSGHVDLPFGILYSKDGMHIFQPHHMFPVCFSSSVIPIPAFYTLPQIGGIGRG